MKKLIIVLTALVFVLIGCSKDNNTDIITKNSGESINTKAEVSKDKLTLEEKITAIMKKKDYPNPNDIIDYEIKDNYIFVLTLNNLKGMNITVLKNDSSGLKMAFDSDIDEATLIGATEKGPFMLVVEPDDKDVKNVKVLGQQTKMLKITRKITEDFKKEVTCWIYVSDGIGKSPKDFNSNKDIKYIK